MFFLVVAQIVSHSRSQDGTWLNPENLRQILTELDSCPTGQWDHQSTRPPGRQSTRPLWYLWFQLNLDFFPLQGR